MGYLEVTKYLVIFSRYISVDFYFNVTLNREYILYMVNSFTF